MTYLEGVISSFDSTNRAGEIRVSLVYERTLSGMTVLYEPPIRAEKRMSVPFSTSSFGETTKTMFAKYLLGSNNKAGAVDQLRTLLVGREVRCMLMDDSTWDVSNLDVLADRHRRRVSKATHKLLRRKQREARAQVCGTPRDSLKKTVAQGVITAYDPSTLQGTVLLRSIDGCNVGDYVPLSQLAVTGTENRFASFSWSALSPRMIQHIRAYGCVGKAKLMGEKVVSFLHRRYVKCVMAAASSTLVARIDMPGPAPQPRPASKSVKGGRTHKPFSEAIRRRAWAKVTTGVVQKRAERKNIKTPSNIGKPFGGLHD